MENPVIFCSMTWALLFWILMLLWLVLGLWQRSSWRDAGGSLLCWSCLLILGWHVFGAPIHG